MSILLTGATGFLGRAISSRLQRYEYSAISRKSFESDASKTLIVKTMDSTTDYGSIFENVTVLIHCAARAHLVNDQGDNSLLEYSEVNTNGTLNLADQAASAGVKRFIFISSIGVNGSITASRAFVESDIPAPHNAYTESKYNAELGLLSLAKKTNMEVVIIRPPLIYGPNPPGNFSSVLKLVKKRYPLPLAGIMQNKRSFIALENLVDFILLCTNYKHTPKASNQIFLISDGEDVSTAELFRRVAKAYGNASYLFPFPASFMCLVLLLLGKKSMVNSLFGSLQIDSSKARDLLGWKPVINMEEQLKKMADFERL